MIIALDPVFAEYGIPYRGFVVVVKPNILQSLGGFRNENRNTLNELKDSVVRSIMSAPNPATLTGKEKEEFDNDLVILAYLYHLLTSHPVPYSYFQLFFQ